MTIDEKRADELAEIQECIDFWESMSHQGVLDNESRRLMDQTARYLKELHRSKASFAELAELAFLGE